MLGMTTSPSPLAPAAPYIPSDAEVAAARPETDIDGNQLTTYQTAIIRALAARGFHTSSKTTPRKTRKVTTNARHIARQKARTSGAPSKFSHYVAEARFNAEHIVGMDRAVAEAQARKANA